MPCFAVIDVGTNSDLLLIAEREDHGWRVILDMSTITRMGEGLAKSGLVGETALKRNIDCLKDYRTACDEHGVEEIVAVGTSALRDARNSGEVLSRIASECGITIEIVSGETEAQLSFSAVRGDDALQFPQEAWLGVIDIGGGSAELILGRGALESAKSVDLGGVRMTEMFLKADPPAEDEFGSMVDHIRKVIPKLTADENLPFTDLPNLSLAGVGGTIVNLANIKQGGGDFRKVHGTSLTLEDIDAQIQRFRSMTLARRREIPGLEQARADIILAGATILSEIIRHLKQTSVRVSNRGLRYGILYERFGSRL